MDRIDLTNWVIHFVHNRIPNDFIDSIYTIFDHGECVIPSYFTQEGKPEVITESMIDEEWPLAENAKAFDVLAKIIHDGYIRSGWSFRNGKPTVYGPTSAVCFTEMPLGSLVAYANKRGKYVETYGIALKRSELFKYGGRPVIYGLSTNHEEANVIDPNYGKGLRVLSSSVDIGLREQYRYVTTNLNEPGRIDWTHEREWRWPLIDSKYGVNGIPILLDDDYIVQFSDIIIIVSTLDEKKSILELLKNLYDSVQTNLGYGYNINLIKNAKVISIEELQLVNGDISKIKIEDISFSNLSKIHEFKAKESTKEFVKQVWEEAKEVAFEASSTYLSTICNNIDSGSAGFSNVYTIEQSEITQALVDLKIAQSFADGRYVLFGLRECMVQSINVHEAGAKAAADYLTKKLGIEFYVYSRLD